jgi:aminomethyltransferase
MNISHPAPRVLQPGLSRITPGTELYEVPAIGAIVIGLEAGDTLTVEDIEGTQPAEIAAYDRAGNSSLGVLGLNENSTGDGITSILGANSISAQKVRFGLEIRGLSIKGLKTYATANCFGCDRLSVTAMEDCVCIIAAPGKPMIVSEQNPPTGLKAKINRINPKQVNDKPLPDPLAEPRFEQRIAARTAKSFTVKAGEYIQILDVAGRECSDFQAFNIKQLEKGIECPIDITGTRTMMGHGYPLPGLHSKYLDANHDPMIEVIQDTVGRHDTFGYACTAKYYEDQGYFGHANCSDNFNYALNEFGIRPRRGWEAVNFFYNTGIDDHNVLYLDEPWSRPGDYVLLQALTDLICVSSACPDDTTAANSWDPTDIHVRVYAEKSHFKRAIAFRRKPDEEMKLTQETGFHEETSKLTRNFVEYKCYWLASHYNNYGKEAEYYACRDQVAVIDLSALRKFEIIGEDAEELLQWTLTRNVKKLAQGQVVYSAMCYEHGGMFDDGTLLRLGDNQFRWIGGSELGGDWLREQAAAKSLHQVTIKSSTDQIHNIAVQGPRSRELLKKLIWTAPQYSNMDELGWFRFSVGRLHDHQGIPIMISRTGYTGELGYELWCHPQHASKVWQEVFAAGAEFGIAPLGLDALDMLRIEAGLIFADYEFTEETDPFEAGIGFSVPLKSKEDDFLGKEALIRRKASPMRKLVGLELAGNEIASHGDCVHVGRPQIGTITSGTRSPKLGKNIALCRIDVTHAEIGTEVEIGKLDGHQKRLPARVVAFPFYDPDKSRVRS